MNRLRKYFSKRETKQTRLMENEYPFGRDGGVIDHSRNGSNDLTASREKSKSRSKSSTKKIKALRDLTHYTSIKDSDGQKHEFIIDSMDSQHNCKIRDSVTGVVKQVVIEGNINDNLNMEKIRKVFKVDFK